MPRYIVVNHHRPEECGPMEAAAYHIPRHLEGKDFYCTCPEGPHGFYMIVDGDTAEEVIGGLPPELRRGTEAYPVEVIRLTTRAPTK